MDFRLKEDIFNQEFGGVESIGVQFVRCGLIVDLFDRVEVRTDQRLPLISVCPYSPSRSDGVSVKWRQYAEAVHVIDLNLDTLC